MKSTTKEIIFHRYSFDPGLLSFLRRSTEREERLAVRRPAPRQPFVRGR